MIGRTVSRYRIEEKLGEGGMGVVYRAEDLRLKRPVALKFLPPHLGADLRAKERFLQEAQAASALDHPNICVIYEIDETETGELFIAMTCYAGETLSQKIRRGPMAVQDALEVARQVALGLSKAHDRGIIHRDIKPANLMATEDGIWKILDFGIAKLSGTSHLTRTGKAVGTVAYMAPEQAERDEVSPQSDIWSLGVVLYEMLAGRLPFQGATPVATLYQVLQEEPESLLDLRGDVPPALDRIVTRALSKDLGLRYRSMGDFLTELHLLEETPGAGIPPPDVDRWPEEVAITPLPFLTPSREPPDEAAPPPFVGRTSELATLDRWLEEASSGQGRVGFISGEAGTGKTALAREFCRSAAESTEDLIVVTGECNAHTGLGDPHRPFREILAQLTGDVETQWAAGSISAEHATRLWRLLPSTAQALIERGPDLVGTFVARADLMGRAEAHPYLDPGVFDDLSRPVEAQSTIGAIRQTDLFEQYVRVVRALATKKLLVFVVDDLQWADTGTIGLFFELSRRLAGCRVLVLGLYRTTEVALGRDGQRHPLEPLVHELGGLYRDAILNFSGLDDRNFIDSLIDAEPNCLGERFRGSLFQQTRGHALFTAELLRALKEGGLLQKNESDEWDEGEAPIDWKHLPSRVDAVIGERIGRLPPDLQRLLTVASIEGERFTLEVIAKVTGAQPKEMIGPLSLELERRHNLIMAEGIQQVTGQRLSIYRFRNILFQRYLYDRLDAVERPHLHEQVGEALEALHGRHANGIALALARHFGEAGLSGKAAEYFFSAGNQALEAFAPAEALGLFESALREAMTLPPSRERDLRELAFQLAIGDTKVRLVVPGYPDAFARASQLAEKVGTAGDRFLANQGLYWVAYYGGFWEQAKACAEKCVSAAREARDNNLLVHALALAGAEEKQRAERHTAVEYFEELIRLYTPDQNRASKFYGLDVGPFGQSLFGLVQWELGYPEKAKALFEAAAASARRAKDPVTLAMVLFRDSLCTVWSGEMAAAEAKCEEWSAADAEGGGGHAVGPWLPIVQGWCNVVSGRVEEGIHAIGDGMQGWETAGMKVGIAIVGSFLGRALCLAGRPEKGLMLLEEILADPLKNELANRAETQRTLGDLYLALPHPDEMAAEAAFRSAIEIAHQQDVRSWELLAATSLARLLQKQGRRSEARAVLGEIYGWFTEGHDLPYLVEVRELLTQLGAPP